MPIALIRPGGISLASGIWPSVSGAAAQAQNVDVIANNLANSDTLAFKKDLPTFQEYLSSTQRDHTQVDIPRGPIKDKDLYPLDGRDQSFVIVDGTYTNFRQGALRVTQSPLDIALDGPGFLEVATPNGVRYTRQGSLHIAPDGRLVTMDGHPVLASQPGGITPPSPVTRNPAEVNQDAPSEAGRFINLRDRGAHFSITDAGEIYAGEDLVAKLSVVEFADTKTLRKQGGSLFTAPDVRGAQPTITQAAKTTVRQGVLETSNVNPIEEMTNLIKANRLFEQDLKAMKTYGEMMQREANDIGKL